MEHASNSASGSGLYVTQSQLHPEIFSCRWSWCRHTFNSNENLNSHVIEEHIRLVVPVRRRDLLLLRRAEEGIGESLSLGLQSYYRATPSQNEHQEPTSSLPSPPESRPASLSLLLDENEEHERSPQPWPSKSARSNLHDSPMLSEDHAEQHSLNAHSVHPTGSVFPSLHADMPATPTTVRPFHTRTPSFASMSSPINSPYHDLPINSFPALEDMVDRAINDGRHHMGRPHEAQASMQPVVLRSSAPSFASQASVEAHLTQHYEEQEDVPMEDLTPNHANPPTPSADPTKLKGKQAFSTPVFNEHQSTTLANAITPSHQALATPVRQSWYGTIPRQKKVYGRAGSETPSTPKPRHRTSVREAETGRGHQFRSGVLKTPIATDKTYFQPDPELSQGSAWSSPGRSQQKGDISQSYPMQTQAPYFSQSESQ